MCLCGLRVQLCVCEVGAMCVFVSECVCGWVYVCECLSVSGRALVCVVVRVLHPNRLFDNLV